MSTPIAFRSQPETPKAGGPLPREAADTLARLGNLPLEEFRVLRARLVSHRNPAEKPLTKVGVVSASAGEGKTLVAFGLARTLAQHPGRRILLMEVDTRRPSLEAALGLERMPGLCEWLESEDSVVRTYRLAQGFDLLPAGLESRPEALGSPRMTALLDAAVENYDMVVLDCPPLLPVADSVLLQDLVDGFLFVVRFRQSPRNTIKKALERLKEGRVLGFVYNGHNEIIPGEYTYAARRYGY